MGAIALWGEMEQAGKEMGKPRWRGQVAAEDQSLWRESEGLLGACSGPDSALDSSKTHSPVSP